MVLKASEFGGAHGSAAALAKDSNYNDIVIILWKPPETSLGRPRIVFFLGRPNYLKKKRLN